MEGFTKQPAEARWTDVNFAGGLANVKFPGTSDTISTYTITAVDEDTGEVVTTTVIGAGDTTAGSYVYFLAQAGTDGHSYKFTIIAVTSSGQVCEEDIRMKVKSQ